MFLSLLGEAWHAMGANRLRTLLTMLGMIIGVGAVVLMQAIGQGAQVAINESIASMGSNILMVLSGASMSKGAKSSAGSAPILTLQDADAISELPSIAAASPVAPGNAQVVYGQNNWNTQINGVAPSFLDMERWEYTEGGPFNDSDVRAATRVAIIGQTVATNLFGDDDPIGKMIRIKQSPYLVIGALAPKGQTPNGQDQDDIIMVPVTTAQRQLFGEQFQGALRLIMAQATSADEIDQAEREISSLLRQRHHLPDESNGRTYFTVNNMTAIHNVDAETTQTMSFMLGAIASISLVVGGIGIMNMMLTAVTERTREIGIRVAIGAHHHHIMLQFLLEGLLISLAGCLIGALAGVAGALLAQEMTGTYIVITSATVLLAFTISLIVGVISGLYPAWKAGRLKPVESLRHL